MKPTYVDQYGNYHGGQLGQQSAMRGADSGMSNQAACTLRRPAPTEVERIAAMYDVGTEDAHG